MSMWELHTDRYLSGNSQYCFVYVACQNTFLEIFRKSSHSITSFTNPSHVRHASTKHDVFKPAPCLVHTCDTTHPYAQNAEWGYREVGQMEEAAVAQGLQMVKTLDMPANNHVLLFKKS